MTVPMKKVLSEKSVKEIQRLKTAYPDRKSVVLMVLHVINEQFGYIDRGAALEASELLELPVMDLEQAASFYTMFPSKKVGKYHIQVCRTLSCALRGSDEIVKCLKERLGISIGGVTEDGVFSLATVECLASCGTAPAMQINDTYYENLTPARIEKILQELKDRARHG